MLTFIFLASRYPKSRWVIIRESLPTLKRTTFNTFNEIVNKGLAGHIANWNHETHTITFSNGSQILFMSESYEQDKEFNRFRGLEINGAGVDEINECNEKLLSKLFERAGSWLHAIPTSLNDGLSDKPPIVILATCNPSQGWVKETVYKKFKSNTLPDTWAYIESKITDNPHVPESYLDSLRANMPPIEFQRFVEGDWDVIDKIENPFLHQFQTDLHVSEQAVYRPDYPVICSMDFNLNPMAMGFYHHWRDKEGEHLHCFDAVSIENASIPKAVDYIKEKYGQNLGGMRFTGDAMGKRGDLSQRDNATYYIQLQRALKISNRSFVLPGNPTHLNSRVHCNNVLLKVNVKFHPVTAKKLIQDCQLVQCDATGQIMKSNRKIISQQADQIDQFRYLVNAFFKHHQIK